MTTQIKKNQREIRKDGWAGKGKMRVRAEIDPDQILAIKRPQKSVRAIEFD